jgi:hypothetical protein
MMLFCLMSACFLLVFVMRRSLARCTRTFFHPVTPSTRVLVGTGLLGDGVKFCCDDSPWTRRAAALQAAPTHSLIVL